MLIIEHEFSPTSILTRLLGNMVSLEPVNIQRLVRENQRRNDAEVYSKSITKGSVVSGWHEKHDIKGGGPSRTGVQDCLQSLQRPTSPDAAKAALASIKSIAGKDMAQEQWMEKEALLQARKQRLQALMQQERLEYEVELRSRGLSLVEHRY